MLKKTSKLTEGYWRRRLIISLSQIVGIGGVLVVCQHVLALDFASLGVVAQEHFVDLLDVVLGKGRTDAAVLLHIEVLVSSRHRCADW